MDRDLVSSGSKRYAPLLIIPTSCFKFSLMKKPTHAGSKLGSSGLRMLFDRAMSKPREERSLFLRDSCGDDHLLHQNILSLIEAADDAHLLVEPEQNDPRVGEEISFPGGGWRLEEWLGAGGSGAVYRGVRLNGGETDDPPQAAIKILNNRTSDRSRVDRFRAEVELLRKINHPGVVKILDTSFDHRVMDRTDPWIAFELVEGAAWITETLVCEADGDPAWSEPSRESSHTPMSLLLQACDIMSSVHATGIVHRDLKPGNLIVDPDGNVHVIDFGIAKLTEFIPDATTNIGLRGKDDPGIGTPAYMAPEQVDPSLGPISSRTDVHALGVIAFRMLAGRPPFEIGDNILAAAQAVRHVPPANICLFLPELPVAIAAVIERALEKSPDRRQADAGGFASELRSAIAGGDDEKPHRSSIMGGIAIGILVSLTVLWSWIASSGSTIDRASIMVPDDISTIQAAIDLVADGGVIMVRPGTYRENLDFGMGKDRNFGLISTDGPTVTVIDGAGRERSVVFIGNGFDDRTSIEGFTITGGQTGSRSPDGFRVGGGLYLRHNSVSVVDCRLIENRSTFGGNLYSKHFSGGIHQCVFSGGQANAEGGNAFLFRGDSNIQGSRFTGGFTTGDGGGIKVASGCHTLEHCVITDNVSDRGGGVFYVEFDWEPAELQILDSLVIGNTAFDGGGILTQRSDQGPVIQETILFGNKPNAISGPTSALASHENRDCWGDLDGNGVVDATELDLLLQNWGEHESRQAGDFDGDDRTDGRDLALLLDQWGSCPE